jgi:hypothetical protein
MRCVNVVILFKSYVTLLSNKSPIFAPVQKSHNPSIKKMKSIKRDNLASVFQFAVIIFLFVYPGNPPGNKSRATSQKTVNAKQTLPLSNSKQKLSENGVAASQEQSTQLYQSPVLTSYGGIPNIMLAK